MRSDVEITAKALADAEEYYLFIRDHQKSPWVRNGGGVGWWNKSSPSNHYVFDVL